MSEWGGHEGGGHGKFMVWVACGVMAFYLGLWAWGKFKEWRESR